MKINRKVGKLAMLEINSTVYWVEGYSGISTFFFRWHDGKIKSKKLKELLNIRNIRNLK